MRCVVMTLLLVGCYEPPDLPLIDTVPIVANNACDQDREGDVVCVIDGDTFDIGACGDELGERVRMLGVAAPELASPPNPAECGADAALQELARLTEGERVVLSFDEDCVGIYGRTLAYVWLEGTAYNQIAISPEVQELTRIRPGQSEPGLLVNEWLIAQGFATLYPEELFGELLFSAELNEAEAVAQADSRGLWSDCLGGSGATGGASPDRMPVQGPGQENPGVWERH